VGSGGCSWGGFAGRGDLEGGLYSSKTQFARVGSSNEWGGAGEEKVQSSFVEPGTPQNRISLLKVNQEGAEEARSCEGRGETFLEAYSPAVRDASMRFTGQLLAVG